MRNQRSFGTRRIGLVGALCLCGALAGAACGGGNEVVEAKSPPPPASSLAPPPASDAGAPAVKLSLAEQEALALKTAALALNAHDPQKFAGVYAPDALIHVAGANDVSGREAVAANMREWFEAFSQVKLGFSRVWIAGDTVAIEWVINGTHSGELFGVRGTQNQIGHYGLSLVTFDKDGSGVKTERRYGDLGAVATQIGAAKAAKARPIPPLPQTTETIVATGAESEARNLEVVKAAFAALEKKSEKDFVDALADGVEIDGFIHLQTVKGKAEGKKFFKAVTTAFPDLKIEVRAAWPIGDYVLAEYQVSGTHKGPLGDLTPTGRKVSFSAVDVVRVSDRKLARAWTYSNGLELMAQLGQFEPGSPPKGGAKPAPKKGAKKP